MAFGNFDRAMVEQDLGLRITQTDLFSHVVPVEVRTEFLNMLTPGIELASSIDNEKAKSEFIIAPVLLELRNLMKRSFGLFSGVELQADATRGLNGICDFLLTKSPFQLFPQAPLLAIIEAKNDNLHNGLWQAIASAFAAGLVNQAEGVPLKATYGAISNGIQWLFLKVEGSVVTFDVVQYLIDDLGKILGILKHVIETA